MAIAIGNVENSAMLNPAVTVIRSGRRTAPACMCVYIARSVSRLRTRTAAYETTQYRNRAGSGCDTSVPYGRGSHRGWKDEVLHACGHPGLQVPCSCRVPVSQADRTTGPQIFA